MACTLLFGSNNVTSLASLCALLKITVLYLILRRNIAKLYRALRLHTGSSFLVETGGEGFWRRPRLWSLDALIELPVQY